MMSKMNRFFVSALFVGATAGGVPEGIPEDCSLSLLWRGLVLAYMAGASVRR